MAWKSQNGVLPLDFLPSLPWCCRLKSSSDSITLTRYSIFQTRPKGTFYRWAQHIVVYALCMAYYNIYRIVVQHIVVYALCMAYYNIYRIVVQHIVVYALCMAYYNIYRIVVQHIVVYALCMAYYNIYRIVVINRTHGVSSLHLGSQITLPS